MNGFVSKPCGRPQLIQALRQVLKQAVSGLEIQSALKGKIVLLVDDDSSNRAIVRVYLEYQGVQVMEAEDGKVALDCLGAEVDCDAVIMDINMPGLNGLEAIKSIRAYPFLHQQIPVIALTGYSSDASMKEAFDAGVQ